MITWSAVLVVLLLAAIGGAVLVKAVQESTEAARLANCHCHMGQLGVAFQEYHARFGHFPSTGRVVSNGGEKHVAGWGFLVQILPYINLGNLYDTINPDGDPDTPEANPKWEAGRLALPNTPMPGLICPSNPNRAFLDPAASPPRGAISNCKAMGATHIESLNQCLGLGKPLYGEPGMHPDGAMPPGPGRAAGDLADGAAHTILCVETIDDTASLWTRARDTVVVGLPTTGAGAVRFAAKKYRGEDAPPEGDSPIFADTKIGTVPGEYFAPQGFNGKFFAAASDEVKGMRTFLGFDFRPGRADAGTYPAFDGSQPAYGPGSAHPGAVVHLFGDASSHAISTLIDPAAYMFLITRNGGDPYHPDPP
jgi:hypothetical protein